MEKVDKSGHKKKQSMLEALKKSLGVVTTALIKADVPHSTYYKWINTDPEFAEQVKTEVMLSVKNLRVLKVSQLVFK